ncbi:NAD(P)-binding protein [Melanomma pulvis-pyrius CBS 109.77]|uniref:NAD(P)-binding protein n=1 Tax=Melanomma pulvis-pyrius CBS 109.77 TaxID=1314802 RepID=A0A6A6WV23_9PLEO|nr:NAD(P)-binding protein [Melanomma pulvis-pyrius CBS 109.77]
MSDQSDINALTLSGQFTPTMHREVYPAIAPTNPANSAAGKSVLVTGATRGIGKVIALSWAKAGAASIVITGRNKELLLLVAAEIKRVSPKTKVAAIPSEAGSEADTKALWAQIKAEIGLIDVLICNAGVFSEREGFPIAGSIDPAVWWSDMEINIRGPYLHIYNFLQQFLAVGKEPTGTVIILSSAAASFNAPGMSAYSISKLVVIRLTELLHIEHSGVRTFAFHPGLVPTDMSLDIFASQTIDPPELSGGLSLYLSTPRADFLRGTYVSVNWDVEEMEARAAEINEKRLLNTAFLNAKLGPTGHPFETIV